MSSASGTMADNSDSSKRQFEVIDLESESKDRPPKKIMLDFRQHIRILVRGRSGDTEQYYVPANIAKTRSTFMRDRCEEEAIVLIEEKQPWPIRSYLHLICTNLVVLSSDEDSMSQWKKCEKPIALYTLAQKMGDPESTNLIIDHFAKLLDFGLPLDFVPRVYSRAEAGSPVRRVLIHYVAETTSADRFTPEMINRWPPEFLYDVVLEMAKRRDAQGLRVEKLSGEDTTRFHTQPEG